MPENNTAENLTFESAMDRLDTISEMLHSSDIPLDRSLTLYAEAMELISFCSKKLEHAKQSLADPVQNEDSE